MGHHSQYQKKIRCLVANKLNDSFLWRIFPKHSALSGILISYFMPGQDVYMGFGGVRWSDIVL